MSKETMTLALEALKNYDGQTWEETQDAIKALEEALAKQEQGEPVALKVYRGELCYKSQTDDQSFGMWCPVTQDLPFPEGTKFYTTPQPAQKPWAGLTDEEIDYYIVHRCGTATKKNLVELIRLCEIKLKEKNT